MSLGILLVTHDDIGEALLATARQILGEAPDGVIAVGVGADDSIEHLTKQLADAYHRVERGDGVLVLCDLIGATPCNHCCALREHHRVRVVTGINLPLLLRAMSHRDEQLDTAAKRCEASGVDAITACYDGE